MDKKAIRHWRCRVTNVAEPFTATGSIQEVFPRLIVWLSQQRNGDFTLQCSRQPITSDSDFAATGIALPIFESVNETPEPLPTDNWESYYKRLLEHFEGSDSMARFLANEHFDQPQLPWVGDERVTRFIHMNASARLYQKADPAEYAALDSYVSQRYPDLYQSLTLQG